MSAIPEFIEDKEPPVITYKYTKTKGHSIFHFKKVAREHKVDIVHAQRVIAGTHLIFMNLKAMQ